MSVQCISRHDRRRQVRMFAEVRRPWSRLRDLASIAEGALTLGDLACAGEAAERAEMIARRYLGRRDGGVR